MNETCFETRPNLQLDRNTLRRVSGSTQARRVPDGPGLRPIREVTNEVHGRECPGGLRHGRRRAAPRARFVEATQSKSVLKQLNSLRQEEYAQITQLPSTLKQNVGTSWCPVYGSTM